MSEQPSAKRHKAGSGDLYRMQAAAEQAVPQADQTPVMESLHVPNSTSAVEPEQMQLSPDTGQESEATALEEGELPDADSETSDSGPDEPGDYTLIDQTVPLAEKRTRGERAGKRVRQRQARRARDIKLGILRFNGTRLRPGQTHEKLAKLAKKRNLPVCKYVFLLAILLNFCHESMHDISVWQWQH